jgi:beta-1,4-mannosyltransferase
VARYAATLALLARLTLRRTAVVRTLHNVRPHEPGGRLEALVLRALGRRTTLAVRLVPGTPLPPGARPGTPAVTVPHAHYRGWYAGYPRGARVPGRVLFFGLVRPYKGVEELLAAFRDLPGDDVSLRVVGSPESSELARTVAGLAAGDARIGLRLEYVDDATLAAEVGAAQVVVLPYRELHSSGAALLALSLDRPVLVPAGETATGLADEVGARWVCTFSAPVTADDLAAALAVTADLPAGAPAAPHDGAGDPPGASADGTDRPDLSARDWAALSDAHVQAYATAVARARSRA